CQFILYISLVIRCTLSFTLFPYTTLFRSLKVDRGDEKVRRGVQRGKNEEAGAVLAVEEDERIGDARRRLDTGARHAVVAQRAHRDRKSTRLNSSHVSISYAVFCLKKKNKI